jgi:hypothetical protein
MPKVLQYKERRHQPFWDSLIRTTGAPATAIAASTVLFGNANIGNRALTNLQAAGQFVSDQTFVVLALRAYGFFRGTNDLRLYQEISSQLYFTLEVGDKPLFFAPCWYFPAGGGVYGFDSGGANLNWGDPSHESILRLGRPILVPPRQGFRVIAEFFAVGTTNVLTTINTGATDDQKIIMFLLDGLSKLSEGLEFLSFRGVGALAA